MSYSDIARSQFGDPLAQFHFLDLSCRGFLAGNQTPEDTLYGISTHRKFGNDGNPFRGSKTRQPLPGMSFQVDFKFFALVLPLDDLDGMEGDECHWAFTPFGMPPSYDGGLHNIGMGDQFLLDRQAGRVLDPKLRKCRVGEMCHMPPLQK